MLPNNLQVKLNLLKTHMPLYMRPPFLQWFCQRWHGLRVFVPGSHWLCSTSQKGHGCRALVVLSPLPPAWSGGLTLLAWRVGLQYLMEKKRLTVLRVLVSKVGSMTSCWARKKRRLQVSTPVSADLSLQKRVQVIIRGTFFKILHKIII